MSFLDLKTSFLRKHDFLDAEIHVDDLKFSKIRSKT